MSVATYRRRTSSIVSTLGTSDDTNVCHAAQEYLGEFFVGSPQAAPHEPMMKDSRDRHPTADRRTFGELREGDKLGDLRVMICL
jgi:hypothetical protein